MLCDYAVHHNVDYNVTLNDTVKCVKYHVLWCMF